MPPTIFKCPELKMNISAHFSFSTSRLDSRMPKSPEIEDSL